MTAIIIASLCIAALASTAKARMAAQCSEKQTPSRELHCGKANLHHADSLKRFLEDHPWAGTRPDRARLRRDARWLRRYALRHVARARARMVPHYSVREAICAVFGPYCGQALRVAYCESRLYLYARNGQYLGLFQMGDFARAEYGFGWDALSQARAAHRYFLAAGWSPWECKP